MRCHLAMCQTETAATAFACQTVQQNATTRRRLPLCTLPHIRAQAMANEPGTRAPSPAQRSSARPLLRRERPPEKAT